MKVGIYDSGVGGLTVLNEAVKCIQNVDFIYFADTYNAPYGTKSKEEVKLLVENAVEFLLKEDVDALLIACNTATSIAIKDLRKKYQIPLVGMEPAVKYALDNFGSKRILSLATPLTLKEKKYESLISDLACHKKVDSVPLPKLVEFAENFIFDKKIILPYLKKVLSSYDLSEYSAIVLGCTHFPYFRKDIKEIVPEGITIVDGNIGTVRHLKNKLSIIKNKGATQVTFYQSCAKGIKRANFDKYMYKLS